MRPLFISLAVVLVCAWAGFELRANYPRASTVAFTASVLLGLLGLGAVYGAY